MNGLVSESFTALGHLNIRATHETTFEITKEDSLTTRGNCVIGIMSEKACSDLFEDLKTALRSDMAKVVLKLTSCGERDEVVARGSRRMTLDSPVSMVVRKSNYVCGRTLAIGADKAASDLNRALVERLKEGETLQVEITVYSDARSPRSRTLNIEDASR